MSERSAEGLALWSWASMFAVRLLGAFSTFLRLGWAGSKEVERRTREAARGESTQRGFAEESKGCSW